MNYKELVVLNLYLLTPLIKKLIFPSPKIVVDILKDYDKDDPDHIGPIKHCLTPELEVKERIIAQLSFGDSIISSTATTTQKDVERAMDNDRLPFIFTLFEYRELKPFIDTIKGHGGFFEFSYEEHAMKEEEWENIYEQWLEVAETTSYEEDDYQITYPLPTDKLLKETFNN